MNQAPSSSPFQPVEPDWNAIGAAELCAPPKLMDDQRLRLPTRAGDLVLSLHSQGVRLRSEPLAERDYGLLVSEPPALPLELDIGDQSSVLRGGGLEITIGHHPFSLRVCDENGRPRLGSSLDGHFERAHRLPPLARTEQGWIVSLGLTSGEPMYGLGEKWGGLNHRGQLLRSWNCDALGVNAERSYKNTPFCWSPEGWGVFVHTTSAVTHAVGYAPWSQRSYCALIENEYLDLWLLLSKPEADNKSADLLRSYSELTGFAPPPPLWSGGVILSKAYYQDAAELLGTAREVRRRGMPCDTITIDGRSWQDTRTRFAFEWCPESFPDPAAVMQELKQLNFKVCVWEYPLVSIHHPWFQAFADKGWLLKDRRTGAAWQYQWDQQAFGEVLTPLPVSGIVDFTHPDAYAFWRDAHAPLFELGVDMIKADFGEQVEDDNMLAHNGASGAELHNVYAYLYVRCVHEAAEQYSRSGAFLFTRAAWTGSQRFNSQWGGDPQADWEGMMANIRGGLSWGLSGGPFYATDVGGFYRDQRNDALYVRWAQAAVFSAHIRLHGIGAREPWSYSPEAELAVMRALTLRYQLFDYLQRCWQQACDTGVPVQRAMVLAFPQEPAAWAFENQFMFGDELLVAPCFSPQGEVQVYLPEGTWLRFDPEREYAPLAGGRVHALQLGLDEIAVFARAGTEIPLCTAVQLSAEWGSQPKIERRWQAQTAE
ncbi:MAG: glycoside hydrolase family 31 protein [Gammaproteobacteria bacterium]|nr:glycoside hydrolase family 31 protein [Gammaproteobacteria bacterium]